MNASLVCECTIAAGILHRLIRDLDWRTRSIRDRVHERNIDFDSLGDKVLNFTKHAQVILGLDVFGVGGVETGNKASKGCDTDTLTDAKDGCSTM